MYTITTDETLSFVMEGAEQVLALRAKVRVEKSDIIKIGWHDKFSDWPNMQVRMPGTYLPSWIMAGSYWNEEGWDFVLAKKPKGLMQPILFDVLVVETKLSRYKRIIVKIPKEKAENIINWWKE